MAYDEQLAERVRGVLGTGPAVGERKMFGGIAFMLNGNMACGVMGDELIVRVGRDAWQECLELPHAAEMDFTGRTMTGMVVVAAEGVAEDGELAVWIDRGTDFAGSLPPK